MEVHTLHLKHPPVPKQAISPSPTISFAVQLALTVSSPSQIQPNREQPVVKLSQVRH